MILTKLIDRLEIGDWFAARDLASSGRWIVTVAIDSPVVGNQHFRMVDGPGNEEKLFRDAVDAVVGAHRNGKSVLVHCVGGRSRSAAVCAAAIAQLKQKTLCEAYDFVIATHPPARIHPHMGKFLL